MERGSTSTPLCSRIYFCQADFVLIFDVHKFRLGLLIIGIDCQAGDLGQIRDPVRAHMSGDPVCQQGIAVEQESSLGNAVGTQRSTVRHHLVEVFQFPFLQDLGVKPCHAVDGIAAHDSQICHAHLSVVDDGHLSHLVLVARILRADSLQEAAVDLLHNLVYTGQQSGEQLNRPLSRASAMMVWLV